MNTLFSVLPIVFRRVGANIGLLTAIVVGAVLAAALMSTTSIYTDAIRDLGLSYALEQSGPDNNNILVRSTSQVARPDIYGKNREFIESSTRQALGGLLEGQNWAGRSATFFPTPPGGRVSEDESRPRSHFQFVTGISQHIRIAEGRFPAPASRPGSGAPAVEVAIGAEAARRNAIKVGDIIDAHPFWRLDVEPVHVQVAGIIEPLDQSDPYWLGLRDLFDLPSGRWETYPFFVPEETFFQALAEYLPTMSSDFWSMAYVRTARINARNAESVRVSLENLDRVLAANIERTASVTQLPQVLKSFDEKLFFTRIPLLVLVLQIAGIVLYYLFMVSTMVVERQAAEIALLKSRGATTGQVMQIYVIEGLMILLVAVAAGPPLAAGVIALLGKAPVFDDLSGGSYLAVRLSTGAYLWALSGALLAYFTLLWPAYQAARRTVVQQKLTASRPPKEAAFTRYYLDLALVGLGAVLFFQLQRRGTLVTEKLFGEQSADPVALLTPAFFILTVGIFFLRLFPIALRIGAWAVSKTQATAVLFGTWQLVRNPTHYSRLVLLLMLATAVGMFAASFGATLNTSYEDRAAYESGAPLRLQGIRKVQDAAGPAALVDSIEQRYGAESSARALRVDGTQGSGFDRTSFHLLGIDPGRFEEIGFFREDFAGSSLSSILGTLAADSEETPGMDVPADARWLGMWLRPVDLNGRVSFEARVQDAGGRYFSFIFGPEAGAELVQGSWYFAVADLSQPRLISGVPFSEQGAKPPYKLQSLSVRFLTRVSLPSGSVQLDDLHYSAAPVLLPQTGPSLRPDPARTDPGLPGARLLADFQSLDRWEILNGQVAEPLPDELRQVSSGKGDLAVELGWRPVSGQPQTHGLRLRGESRPVQVYASEAFLDKTGLSRGQTTTVYVGGTYIDVQIAGSIRLFPTLEDPRKSPALVANVDRLLTALNRNPRPIAVYPEEVWIKPGAETAAGIARDLEDGRLIATVFDFEQLRLAQQKDPLIAAGWEGILFISFAAILILSAIGFLIYSYLTAQKRTLEFAVLRTMGFSRRQIATVVGFEQVFVIGLGMLAGSLMGLRLGSLMVRYMGLTETGDEVLPPMLLHVSWFTAGMALLVLAAVFVVTIGIVVLLYSRLALHRVLRIGET